MKMFIFSFLFSSLSFAQEAGLQVKIMNCKFVSAQPNLLTTISLPVATGDYTIKSTDQVKKSGEILIIETSHSTMGIDFVISCEAQKKRK